MLRGFRNRPDVQDARSDRQSAPNMFERRIVTLDRLQHQVRVHIDDRVFLKGYADGGGCNCLIHTLQQCVHEHIPIVANREWIRSELCRRFPVPGPNAVQPYTYLDLRSHWEAILELLGTSAQAMGLDPQHLVRPETFRITCIEERKQVVGDEVGSGRIRLYVLNEDFRHFVPLLRTGRL